MDLSAAAASFLQARSCFDAAWFRHWLAMPSQETDYGFDLLPAWQRQVRLHVMERRLGQHGIRPAAAAFFQEADAFLFARWYSQLVYEIRCGLANLFVGQHRLLCNVSDSIPLAGQTITLRALASNRRQRTGFISLHEIRTAIANSCGKNWATFICDGENRVAEALFHQAKSHFLEKISKKTA